MNGRIDKSDENELLHIISTKMVRVTSPLAI